ncbi:MAG: 30S ribosomal protein S20 [Chloroflexi bacterium]|nr:30S ribosomal protein S20 [Chloroflexota bacterium]
MANTTAAEQAMRRSARLRVGNRVIRAKARTEVKDAARAIANDKPADAEKSVREAIRALDKAAQKGIIKKNNAARRKARLMKKLNAARTAGK